MIIAIDPGYTSGTAIAERPDARGNFILTACLEIAWINRFYYADFIVTHGKAIDAIVIERFKLTKHKEALFNQIGSEMPSSRIIGLVEAAAHLAGIFDRIRVQDPYERLSMRIPPDHQTIVGLSNHNQAAYKHLAYYVRMARIKI